VVKMKSLQLYLEQMDQVDHHQNNTVYSYLIENKRNRPSRPSRPDFFHTCARECYLFILLYCFLFSPVYKILGLLGLSGLLPLKPTPLSYPGNFITWSTRSIIFSPSRSFTGYYLLYIIDLIIFIKKQSNKKPIEEKKGGGSQKLGGCL